jgi:hypothetical protein
MTKRKAKNNWRGGSFWAAITGFFGRKAKKEAKRFRRELKGDIRSILREKKRGQ